MLFVHGLGATKERWKDVANVMLYQHGYRAVLVDLLGHGDSDMPNAAEYQPSTQGRRLAQFVRDRSDLFDDGVVFIGLSYGAVSSLEAVLRLQEMQAAGVQAPDVLGVVSVSAPAFYFAALEEAPDMLQRLRYAPFLMWLFHPRFFERVILERAFWHDELIQEADREEVRARYGRARWIARHALGRATLHMVEELKARAHFSADDRRFAGVRCPVLVVGGAQDEIVPTSVQQKLQKSIYGPGSEPVILPDCGHAVPGDQRTAFVDLLVSFLEKLP